MSSSKNPPKTTHLIETYKHRLDKIWCVCGWEGSTEEYKTHKKEAPPLKREVVNMWKKLYSRGNRSLPHSAVMKEMNGFLKEIK